jgi:hypothetical protein
MRRVEIGTDDSDYAFPQEIGSCGHTLDTPRSLKRIGNSGFVVGEMF